jgi:hypothetical protein
MHIGLVNPILCQKHIIFKILNHAKLCYCIVTENKLQNWKNVKKKIESETVSLSFLYRVFHKNVLINVKTDIMKLQPAFKHLLILWHTVYSSKMGLEINRCLKAGCNFIISVLTLINTFLWKTLYKNDKLTVSLSIFFLTFFQFCNLFSVTIQ